MITQRDVLDRMPVGYLVFDHGHYAQRRAHGWWSISSGYYEPQLPVEAIGLP